MNLYVKQWFLLILGIGVTTTNAVKPGSIAAGMTPSTFSTWPARALFMSVAESGFDHDEERLKYVGYSLDNGANINEKLSRDVTGNDAGWTVLMYATMNNAERLVAGLLQGIQSTTNRNFYKGADPNIAGNDGKTALLIAVEKGNYSIVESLLHYGANPNVADKEGNIPLLIAVNNGHYNIAESLLRYGANPHTVDKNGNTPLLIAAQKGYIRLIELLIAHRAHVAHRNNQGKSALDLAKNKATAHVISQALGQPPASMQEDDGLGKGTY